MIVHVINRQQQMNFFFPEILSTVSLDGINHKWIIIIIMANTSHGGLDTKRSFSVRSLSGLQENINNYF